LRVSWGVILPAAIGTILFFLVAIALSLRAQKNKPTTGEEGMVGEKGQAVGELNPNGSIKIRGEFWNAKSKSDNIPAGSTVEVTAIERMLLIVEQRDSD
jgi:membrane-bound serine protease (ClpP class)